MCHSFCFSLVCSLSLYLLWRKKTVLFLSLGHFGCDCSSFFSDRQGIYGLLPELLIFKSVFPLKSLSQGFQSSQWGTDMTVFTSGHRNLVNEGKSTISSGYRGPWSCWSEGSDTFYIASIYSIFERPVMPQGLKLKVPDFLKMNDLCLKAISACPQIWERFTSPDNSYISRFPYRKSEWKNETSSTSIGWVNIIWQ